MKKITESVNGFSKEQLSVLKKQYGTLDKIDPTSKSYKSLIALLDNLPQSHLKQLAAADIKFVSVLAKNRIKKDLKEAATQKIKVGDKIRTIRGGQTAGVVTKIDGDTVHFDHATATYQTVWSGAKGKPKQYATHISNVKLDERCWSGYKPTPGKEPYEKGSCMKESDDELYEEAEHEGKSVTLNKPFRTPDGPKKFAVYVKNDKGNVVKVTFGDPNMEIKRDDPERRANYRARHNCSDPGPKWKANYWSCKMWADKPVSKITEDAICENTFSFTTLDGPKTRKTVGGLANVAGESPQDALKRRYEKLGHKNIDIKLKDSVIVVTSTVGSSKEIDYYELKESISEAAPPDPTIEKWIKSNKERFKDQYGAEKGTAILYAKAWKMYNDK